MKREKVRGVTIDDSRTWDIDDALWAEEREDGIVVFISIADVAKAVLAKSEVDSLARERVATRYFATGNSPMLPRSLAEGSLSLFPEEMRRSMTVEVFFPQEGEQTVRVYASRVRSEAKLTYDQIPGILADKENPFHVVTSLLARLSTALLDKRRKHGALALYDLNNGWVTTEEGSIKQLDRREDTVGYIIVQEMMILANASVATFAIKHDIPILFRNHVANPAAPYRETLIAQLETAIHSPLENLASVRQRVHMLMNRAEYASTVSGHYGLALPAYTHWTSPIRRYADLVSQRQFRAFLRGEPFPHTREEVEEIAVCINATLTALRDATSQQFAESAEKRAHRIAFDYHRIDGLNAKDFERVVKVQARSGADATEDLVKAYKKRLLDERAPIVASTVLFTEAPKGKPGWDEMRLAFLAKSVIKPDDAVSLLSMAGQKEGWSEPRFTVNKEGSDHAPVFRAQASVGALQPGDFVEGATAKEAKQRAAVSLLARVLDVELPAFPPVRIVEAPKTETKPEIKHPVSALMEMSQKAKIPPPDFTFNMEGPPHATIVTCTCTMSGVSRIAKSNSKQQAKADAAQLLVQALTQGAA